MRQFLTRATAGLVAVLLIGVTLGAQAKPDFSGRWTRVDDPAAAGAAGGGRGGRGLGWGDEVVVKQNAATLSASMTQADGSTLTWTYNLDGSPSKNSAPGRQGGPPVEVVSRATWQGSTLATSSTVGFTMEGTSMTATLKQNVSLDAKGMLTVEASVEGLPVGQAATTKQIYRKN